MDVGKNVTLALYLIVGVGAVLLLLKVATPPLPEPTPTLSTDNSAAASAGRDAADVLRAQVQQLERELAERTRENARLQSLLRETSAQLEKRKRATEWPPRAAMQGLDEAALEDQLAALLAEIQKGTGEDAGDAAGNKRGAAASDPSDAALELIALLEQQHHSEIEKMQAEIRQGDEAMAQFREEMEEEITDMLEADQAFHLATTEAVLSAGAAAVPGLQRLLSHSRPEIREWAAYVLGRLGPLAQEAVPSLLRLAADSSEAVRVTAAEAIEAIERGE